jgi:hypothetical protein
MVMRYLIALVLGLHGLINAMGFAATWGLAKLPISASPEVLPQLTSGGGVVRVFGILWLLAAIGFVVGAAGLASASTWWKGLTLSAALLSLTLCVAWWTDAKAGAVIDIVILVGLAAVSRVPRPAAA